MIVRSSLLRALSLALFVAFATTPASAAESPRVGAGAPAFAVADEDGKVHELADYRGKVVVLEWTNPDCPYVARHYKADTMEKLAAKYDAEVVWLAVNSTHYNQPADTKAWKQEQGFSYATLQDASGELGRRYGARTTPNMFVIDPEGVLRYSGAIDDDPYGKASTPKNYVGGAVDALLVSSDPKPAETRPYGCSVKYQ